MFSSGAFRAEHITEILMPPVIGMEWRPFLKPLYMVIGFSQSSSTYDLQRVPGPKPASSTKSVTSVIPPSCLEDNPFRIDPQVCWCTAFLINMWLAAYRRLRGICSSSNDPDRLCDPSTTRYQSICLTDNISLSLTHLILSSINEAISFLNSKISNHPISRQHLGKCWVEWQ